MKDLADQEVRDRLSKGDRFFSHFCYRCTLRGAAFVLREKMVRVCPECVQERIALLDLELGGLPPDLEVFRKEAVEEVRRQQRVEKLALSVDWNYVWKCHRCGHLARKFEIRLIPAEPGGRFTHHRVCYCCYLVWREEQGERRVPAFDESNPSGPGKSYGGLTPCVIPEF